MTRLGRRSGSLLSTLILIGAILLLASAVPVWAQVTTAGTVTGTVTDKTGAVVAGATVTLTDTATSEERTGSTNSAGQYTFVSIPPGTYSITVTKSGFSKSVISAQQVKVGTTTTANIALEVGAASQTVEVAATGVELQTTNATIGNTVTGVALDSLPSLGRDVSTFVTLQPGVSPDGSVAGTVVDQSSFQLDGGNNTNDMDGSMSVYTTSFAGDPTGSIANQSNGVAAGPTGVMPTPADSVEEFKVNSALQGADFNSSSGAQVQVVTKRGTGTWHGTLYEYYLDNNFNANTWQNNHTGTPIADYHYNRFGAAAGGPILPKMLGGKTYFFANYQGFRWPDAATVERAVPSAAMRAGFLTFNGVQYNVAAFDPLGMGINPLMQSLWNKYMPASNESGCGSLSRCDGVNIQGFRANVGVPHDDNFGVARLDHDFGDKWHFMSSYRYYNLKVATTDQVDIGGFFPGDTLGNPASKSNDPQQPWYLVAGMTTNITSNTTNDFHYSYLRNFWSWARAGGPVQVPGLGGALEPFGETATQALIPYNVNTQQTRTRFWDGHDNTFKDDVTTLHGKHMIQFGGQYQRNWDYHQRTDNGGGINYYPVYQLGTTAGAGISMTGFVPDGLSSSQAKNWGRDYAAMLGIVSISQIAYTRSGSDLTLNQPLTPATDKSTIPYYNIYGSDTWRVTPRFTLTYGLGWTLEMPPTEQNGKQVTLVDATDHAINLETYLHNRESAALAGQVYNPEVGFVLNGGVAGHPKYPYNPFYKEFSPRVAAAYDVFGDGNSVFRAGYNRIYGRLNGVDLVLVPLLGPGLIQAVQCIGPTFTQSPTAPCGGAGAANPMNAFRVGVNGLVAPLGQPPSTTLPQPLFPGINGSEAAAGEALDPNFRPNVVDSYDVTFQHQMSRQMSFELGYIGRRINNEYQPININAVPYMMTLGGQRFDKAYANVVLQYCGGIDGLRGGGCAGNAAAVTPQPFFETALAGTGYCNGFANCTQALVANEGLNGTGNLTFANVWSLWSDLDNGGGPGSMGFNFPHTMLNTTGQLSSGIGVNASVGYGYYNAGFFSLKMSDWKGLTMQSNFTWSKALGTGAEVQATSADTAPDPFNLRTGYGLQSFDRPIVFNTFFVYQPPFYKGQHGLAGHLLGGWTFAPVFVAGSGSPITLGTINGGGQAFGEGDSVNYFGYGNSENAIPIGQLPGVGVHYTNGVQGIGTGGYGVNLFANPAQAFNDVRQPILGLDTHDGGFGVVRGLPYWNMDFSLKKQFFITERVNVEAQVVFTNVFNHMQWFDPGGDYLDTSSPSTWGTLPGQLTIGNGYPARQMEFGFRVSF